MKLDYSITVAISFIPNITWKRLALHLSGFLMAIHHLPFRHFPRALGEQLQRLPVLDQEVHQVQRGVVSCPHRVV